MTFGVRQKTSGYDKTMVCGDKERHLAQKMRWVVVKSLSFFGSLSPSFRACHHPTRIFFRWSSREVIMRGQSVFLSTAGATFAKLCTACVHVNLLVTDAA